ncbi:MAG TPA: efflux RND transporter periplasmic adaptor subunit [Terriglobales bacterium]|nr:efflux RND transporter periplasmic adaptor subunit [Terriglobales bacterium]
MKPPTPRRLFALAALATCAAALTACSSGGDQPAPQPVVAVQVAPARLTQLQQWVRAQAVLYPLHQAVITPKISAPVRQFFVNRGDRVHQGEPLAQLENRDLAAAAQEAEAQLAAAQAAYQTATAGSIPAELQKAQLDDAAAKQTVANLQKIADSRRRLFQQGALPRRDLDQANLDLTNAKNAAALADQHIAALEHGGHAQAVAAAKADLDAARARATAAEAQLSYSKITSPMDGVVADRPVYPGELATPSSPLMTIVELSQVVARVPLPAAQAALLKLGDQATLSLPGNDRTWKGSVTVVSPATDPGSTTVEVWVRAANPGGDLKPGTTAAVAMLARTLPDALTVPASALLTDDSGATSVMVVGSDSKAHSRPVEVGVREPDQVQIVKGLKPGERVVSVGAYALADNSSVTIAPAAGAGAPQP